MKKWIFTLLQFVLTVVLVGSLFHKVDVGAAWARASGVPPATTMALLLMILAQIALVAWRMKLVAHALGRLCPWRACLRSNLASAFVGQTPLTNFGGDLVRVWCIIREGLTLRDAASIVTIDRVLGLISLVALTAMANVWLWSLVDDDWMRWGILIGTSGAVGGIALLLVGRYVPGWTQRSRIVRWLAELSATLGRMLIHPGYGIGTLVIGIVGHVISVAVLYVLFRTLGTDVSFFTCLVLTPFPLLLSLLPLSVSGWGVREGALVVAFGLAGVPAETTLAVSVLFGLILLASSLPGGLLLLRYPIPEAGDQPASTTVR